MVGYSREGLRDGGHGIIQQRRIEGWWSWYNTTEKDRRMVVMV